MSTQQDCNHICPECAAGSHRNCSGVAWCDLMDYACCTGWGSDMSKHEPGTPVLLDMPDWAVDAIAALIEHEDVHANGDQCYTAVVDAMPHEIRAFVSGYAQARRRYEPAEP